jgi:hypothetical protein
MSSGGSSLPPPATVSGQASGSNNNNNNNNDNSDGNACYRGPRNRHGGRSNNNNNNNNNNNSTTRGPFKGKATDLHGFIYDVGLPNSNNDLFSKTTKEIAEHVSRTIEGAGDFHLAMVSLTLPTLMPPSAPANAPGTKEPSWVDKEQYKLQYSEYIKKTDKRSSVQAKVFPLMLGQCSCTIRDRLEASPDWNTINTSSDVLELLKLIQKSMYTKSTNRHPTHAPLYEAEAALIKFCQGDDMSNSNFLEKFKSLLDIYIHAGGDPGCTSARYCDFTLDTEDPDNDATHYKLAIQRCRDDWVGMTLLLKSDPKRYNTLMADLINSYTRGQDVYPNNPTSAYDMLVNYHSPTSNVRAHVQDHSLAFAQDSDASGCGGRGGRGRCGGRGYTGRGGRGSGGGGSDTNATTISSSSNNNNNINEPVSESYTTCSLYDSRPAECFLQTSTIPNCWLIIDSCSSVNMVTNEELLHDITPVQNPINVHCNAGTVSINRNGLLGDYPERVWFNPHGIANILSLDNVSQHYNVTMDTSKSNSIALHHTDGSLIHFTPCSKGLYHYALQQNETVTKFWSMISTMAGNANQFTKRQYKSAVLARRVQNIIMRPGSREFMDLSINHIRNCPINKQHIQTAESIFGPNLGSLKGKTTYHAPPHVVGHITLVPHDILANHRNIHLTVDIMYINKLPFLITYSRSLRFATVEFLDNRQTPTIRKKAAKHLQPVPPSWFYHHQIIQ